MYCRHGAKAEAKRDERSGAAEVARAAANTADALLSECVDLAAIAAALLAGGDAMWQCGGGAISR